LITLGPLLGTACVPRFALMLGAHVHKLIQRFGYELRRATMGLSPREVAMVERVRGITATGPGRIVGLMDAVEYVVKNRIPGPIVECGVWRGGSVVVAALTLLELGDRSRDIFLFDTFEGMSEPTTRDRLGDGTPVGDVLSGTERRDDGSIWALATLDTVRKNVLATGYPADKLHFVQGKVEDTVPASAPESIALLRLDTDWYESTLHELEHLYPRLHPGGVLILDDYGHWQGAREAVDEYFSRSDFKPLLGRLDETGRMVVKPGSTPGAT
jgi:O-methyltransferase